MSIDLNRVYKITVVRAPEIVDVEGLSPDFFESLETVTEITDHAISFKVQKNLSKQPNTCELTIENLAAPTRDELVKGQLRLVLEAGYDNTPRLLFLGDVRYASNELEGTTWHTKLQLADGGRAFAEARIAKSYAPKTPLLTILRAAAKSLGLTLPEDLAGSAELQQRIPAGEALVGYTSDELTRVLAEYGYEWSIQNGQLQVLRADEARLGVIRVISQDDGMIGAPTMEPPKISAAKKSKKVKIPKLTFRHTLFPELVPGERFELRSRSINGMFRIDRAEHEGETHGSDWITIVEAIEL